MIEQELSNAMKRFARAHTAVVVIVAALGLVVSGVVYAAEPILPTNWVFTLPAGWDASGVKNDGLKFPWGKKRSGWMMDSAR